MREISRVNPSAAATPAAIPARLSRSPSASIIRRISPRCAPIACRMPISAVALRRRVRHHAA
jgi:hypothetical protein